MPQKAWVQGEEVLAADFNSYVQNQLTPTFTGTAQRDAQWASPPNGAVCITVDTGAFWQRIGGVWYKPFSQLGYAQTTAATNGITGAGADIAGLSVTLTMPAGRRIRIAAYCSRLNGAASNSLGYLRIVGDAGAILQQAQGIMSAGSFGHAVTAECFLTPSAGAHTYKVNVMAATANVNFFADGQGPGWIEVRDIGAA